MRPLAFVFATLAAMPATAQELPDGQGEAEYRVWLDAQPGRRGEVMSFEAWQDAAGVRNVLPTWQVIRTASMWRQCGGEPFEVPPFRLWPGMTKTLAFIRDHVKPAVGEVEAVSGYRNPALNGCARGSAGSAHLDFFAIDLIPLRPTTRRQLFQELCPMHARYGRAAGAGLGFYAFTRFHIDTRSFRRWGGAGPAGNESPCAVLERGGDPEAPPLPPSTVTMQVPAQPQPRPAPDFRIETIAETVVARLPPQPLYWRVEAFPTLAAAQARSGPTILAAAVGGRFWRFTLGAAGGPAEGQLVAEIGPVPIAPAARYRLRVNRAGGPPGATTDVHSHPGSEAFYVLAGQLGQRTAHGVTRLDVGGSTNGHAPGMVMQLRSTGTTALDQLVLFVVDADRPFSSPASFD